MNEKWDNDKQDALIKQAEEALNSSIDFFQQAVAESSLEDEDDDGGLGSMQRLQLVLQYRLDTQDGFLRLLHCQQSLLQILGISSLNSEAVNIERLCYALGSDELHQMLTMLNKLVAALLRTIEHLKAGKTAPTKRTQKQYTETKTSSSQKHLVQALERQKSFAFVLAQLTQSLQVVAGAPMTGPTLNHIAQLQGPLSRFFQAIQNGMALSGGLYQQLAKETNLDMKLGHILNKTQDVLKQVPQLQEKPKLFAPSNALSPERLDELATTKRLRPFFNR